MADKYSTIQQHQPLRTPQGWGRQEKALVVQLDEIFDDIYRRFGRLKVSDFGSSLKDLCLVKDEDGHYISVQTAITGIQIDIQEELDGKISKTTTYQTASDIVTTAESYTNGKLESYSTTEQTASAISSAITNALGDYSTTEQTASMISLAVGDCYGKVSNITIDTNGIEITGNKYVKIGSGSTIRMVTGAAMNVQSGSAIDVKNSDNTANIIELSASGFLVYSGGRIHIESGGEFDLKSGSTFKIQSGSDFLVRSGGTIRFADSGGTNVLNLSDSGIEISSNKYVKISAGSNGYWKYEKNGLLYYNTSDTALMQFGDYSNAVSGVKSGVYTGQGVTILGRTGNAIIFQAKHPTTSTVKRIAFTHSGVEDYDCFSPMVDKDVDLGSPSYRWGYCYAGYLKLSGIGSSNGALYVAANTNSWLYGDVYASNIINNSSRDIKHSISRLPSVGNKIDSLIPVSFVYDNDMKERTRYGFIYEDTLPVLPDVCTKDESNKAISYIDMIALLVKEVQDLRVRMANVERS